MTISFILKQPQASEKLSKKHEETPYEHSCGNLFFSHQKMPTAATKTKALALNNSLAYGRPMYSNPRNAMR